MKANQLKDVFQDANMDNIMEFVASNKNLSVDELVECYLATMAKSSLREVK